MIIHELRYEGQGFLRIILLPNGEILFASFIQSAKFSWGGVKTKGRKIYKFFFGLSRQVELGILLDSERGKRDGLGERAIYCGFRRNKIFIWYFLLWGVGNVGLKKKCSGCRYCGSQRWGV